MTGWAAPGSTVNTMRSVDVGTGYWGSLNGGRRQAGKSKVLEPVAARAVPDNGALTLPDWLQPGLWRYEETDPAPPPVPG